MFLGKEKELRNQIIAIGKKLYALRLVVARSGNLSARLDNDLMLVTASGTSLGDLANDDILKVSLEGSGQTKDKALTSEFPLHSLVHTQFPGKVIIHCHPSLINAYFAVCAELKALTFETKMYVGTIPIVEQETPSITRPELVVQALKNNNLVVIKNHGVVAIADTFRDALYLIEALEEAVKVAAVARLFKKDILDGLDKELKESLKEDSACLMFSAEHIQAIVDLVNRDEFILKKGQELDLTLQLAIALDGLGQVYRFNFEKGRIAHVEQDENAPFVISAPAEVWEAVFLGKADPFVLTTQGKMKLKGDLGKLSRWYVPFSRLFELFKQVPIK
ncbi:MAG TPA: class II aldolase/adducin family protein [Patescibacteria group bacterium]|nr:class II aldolase/adducin family protein [Patescibacteria group bacterium]